MHPKGCFRPPTSSIKASNVWSSIYRKFPLLFVWRVMKVVLNDMLSKGSEVKYVHVCSNTSGIVWRDKAVLFGRIKF